MSFIKYLRVNKGLMAAFFICSTTAAWAQERGPNYKFLEFRVTDSAGHPVADAEVVSKDGRGQSIKETTDQQGQLKKGLLICSLDCTDSFTVSKPGYYTFTDIFEASRLRPPITLELLLISKIVGESQAVGDEQLKREIFVAAKQGDAASIRRLLKMGLNPNLKPSALRGVPGAGKISLTFGIKDAPLILFAVHSGDAESVKVLLSAGAKVRGEENLNDILKIYFSAEPRLFSAQPLPPDWSKTVTLYDQGAESLINAGAGLDPEKGSAITPLMIAAEKGFSKTVRLLIKKGVSINTRDYRGKTALIYAIDALGFTYSMPPADALLKMKSQIEIIKYLLKSGADPNIITTANGTVQKANYHKCETALIAAINVWKIEVVRLLINFKANVNPDCGNGETILGYAKGMSRYHYQSGVVRPQLIELLEASGAK